MTQPSLEVPGGSYDDLPEIDVATTLTVPIRLPGPFKDPRSPLVRPPQPASHVGRHRSGRTTNLNRGPARHRLNSAAPRAAMVASPRSLDAVLKVGLSAASLVLAATAVGLLLITWLVR